MCRIPVRLLHRHMDALAAMLCCAFSLLVACHLICYSCKLIACLHSCLQECHCMLFLTEDNDFAGREQNITIEEIHAGTSSLH